MLQHFSFLFLNEPNVATKFNLSMENLFYFIGSYNFTLLFKSQTYMTEVQVLQTRRSSTITGRSLLQKS